MTHKIFFILNMIVFISINAYSFASESNSPLSNQLIEINTNNIAPSASTENTNDEIQKTINHGLQATVLIQTEKGLGSGFFISSNGYILTNYHVIKGAKTITITTYNKKKFTVKTLKSYSQKHDLALLKIKGESFPFLELESSQKININDPVFIIGHPHGHTWTFTKGYIAGKRTEHKTPVIQFSADISPGNSGGPVINSSGKLCAVTTYMNLHKIKFSNGAYVIDPSNVFKFGIDVKAFRNILTKPKKKNYSLAKLADIHNKADITNYMAFTIYTSHLLLKDLKTSIQKMDYKKIYQYSDTYTRTNGKPAKSGTNIKLASYNDFLDSASNISALGNFLNKHTPYPTKEINIDTSIKQWRKAMIRVNKSIDTILSTHNKSERKVRELKKQAIKEFNNSLSAMYQAILSLNKASKKYSKHILSPFISQRKINQLEKLYYNGKLRISREDLKI